MLTENYLSQLNAALEDYRRKYSLADSISPQALFGLLLNGYQDGRCSLPPFHKVFPQDQVPKEIQTGLLDLVARILRFLPQEKQTFQKRFQELMS